MAVIQTQVGLVDLESFVPPVKTIPGTSYTLTRADVGSKLLFSANGSITITVPNDSAAPIQLGATIKVVQTGNGKVSFSPAAGVTVNAPSGNVGTSGQHAEIKITKHGTNNWHVAGSVG